MNRRPAEDLRTAAPAAPPVTVPDTEPPLPVDARRNLSFLKIDKGESPATLDRNRTLARPQQRLVLSTDPFDARSEKIRVLRTELVLRRDEGEGANIVAVLSPQPGEGRSQLAAELAVSFAQLGRPTLLVDADLRNPVQHILFGTDNRSGLSRALADREAPYLRPVESFPGLSLLTAGPRPQNPVELLSDTAFAQMVDSWRTEFEYVVIDTPPASRFSDGLAVATVAGRVLTVVRAAHTPYAQTREMLRRLSATQSRIVGAVLNHF
ncbi:MAG TPA: CpsD/CapB family tyrosine-protein kinase [Candidatus Binatia bacterium]|nr:CpsD/CapB family tyrosine-protein kinase [Candidatus Binatia bacterium]